MPSTEGLACFAGDLSVLKTSAPNAFRQFRRESGQAPLTCRTGLAAPFSAAISHAGPIEDGARCERPLSDSPLRNEA
jgi:hypothetical protein